MATAGSGRGPIKVGSGYIDVYPSVDEKKVKALKGELQKQLSAAGIAAGKDFSEGVAKGMANIPKASAVAAKEAREAVEKAALDSKKVLKKIEKEVTAAYGEEAGKRFKQAQKFEAEKAKLVEKTSAATKKALQSTLAAEKKNAEARAAANSDAEKSKVKSAEDAAAVVKRIRKEEEASAAAQAKSLMAHNKMVFSAYAENEKRKQAAAAASAKAEMKWATTVASAYAENEKRKQKAIAETAALQRTQMTNLRRTMVRDLQTQLDSSRDYSRALQDQVSGYRRSVTDLNRTAISRNKPIQQVWKSHGHAIETVGTQATETGKLITTNLLGPLALVAGALTTIGVKSADSLKMGQMGLMGSGVSAKDSVSALNKIRQYGVDTPYSIEDMQTYIVRYIRSIESHDKDFKSPNIAKQNAAGKRAADKAGDLVMMVGDNAARAGNLDPSLVQRGMYAIDMMLDSGRVNTRQLKQFAQAAGVSVEEMSLMLGFTDSKDKKKGTASAQMLKKMANASKTGGVDSQDLINELLSNWSGPGGAKGRAALVGTSTISGKLQQLKEQSQVGLGNLFAKPDKKTGLIEYTGLGEKLMGKKVKKYGTDRFGFRTDEGYEYQGGLLNDAKDFAKGQNGNAVGLMNTFFDSIGTFAKQIKWAADFMNGHPEWKSFFKSLVKMAAMAAPFILALGLATKIFGKITKLLGSAFTPFKALGKGIVGVGKGARAATRVGRQAVSGISSARNGNGYLQGYRDRRTDLRGGDTRGPIRRTTDRARGRNTQTNNSLDGLNRQISNTDDIIKQVEERTKQLQRQIRDLNGLSMDELIHQFGGGSSATGSLQTAANHSGEAVSSTQTQIRQLNEQNLRGINQEFSTFAEKVELSTKAVGNAKDAVGDLDKKNFTSLKVSLDSLHGVVTDLKDKIDQTGHSVSELDRKKLTALKTQQIESTKNQAEKLVSQLKDAAQHVSTLNGKSLKGLRKEITSTTTAANNLSKKLKELISRVTSLNGKSLASIQGKFKGGKSSLYNAVNEVYKLLGTGNSGVNGRVTSLNKRSLGTIIKAVKSLSTALEDASGHASTLDRKINEVNGDSSFGGGGSSSKKKKGKKLATGGVVTSIDASRYGTLPGYSPGVDNIPAVLSPGEAVLRPEVAKALGPTVIDSWNAAAMSGQIQKFARGTSAASQLMHAVDMSHVASLFTSTLGFDASANGVDSRTNTSLVPWGSRNGGRTAGAGAESKLREIASFFTDKLPDLLKRAPNAAGKVGGIIAGAMAPSAGQYFWDDVWKGNGNIASRSNKFILDLFSPKNIWKMIKDSGTGVWDSIKALGSSAKDLIKNPMGVITDQIKGMKDDVTGYIDGVKGSFNTIKEFASSPGGYTKQVFSEFWSQAKDAMPNTTGLFKFANGGVVPGYSPDDDRVHALLSPGEAVLRPEAARALGLSNIGLLNKAAKNGDAKNLKDKSGEIIPAPDAEAFKKASDQIDSSLKGSKKSVEGMRDASNKAWTDTGSKIKSSVNSTMAPAIKSLSSQEGTLQKNTASKMSAVKSSVSSAASGTSKYFGNMKSGLSGLSGSFSNAQKNIGKSMDRIPASVKSNVKSAVSFIQSAMISPVNSKLLGPAKLSKIGNMPGFATGGVVPGYAPGRDSVLAMVSPGESILRPEVTRALGEGTVHALNQAAIAGKLPAYATGGVVGSDWSDAVPGMFSDTAGPILKKLVSQFGKGVSTSFGRVGQTGVKKAGPAITELLSKQDKKFMDSMEAMAGGSGGAARWSPLVLRVLKELGLSSKYLSLVLHRINVESGGNPKAINLWDSNAKAGYPSQGLMQTIPGTFNAYAGPYKKLGITNPLASIYAGLNYATHRYGSHWTQALSGTAGYWTGTKSASPGLKLVGERGPELVNFKGGERVYNNGETQEMLGGGRAVNLTINEAKSEDTTQAAIRAFRTLDALYGNKL
ncbi:transglycosylase SLT domain-containing protein [Streptomyces sp. NBC_01500]|uniref:transglycosylase SLT domain-containing protein n=1 Tax=Streptomyces sp. NBC_01500 TaxID=2903886 RepID=UPI0022559CD1|nr:transglycosylase SLT domain-containing protein [Streptomyces sp. NBC_01500]MCX4554138.1 transglycosylase SLT domain-containing protein [Streptomyces sp. NBC_01500]